ncbi:heavy-metal-associated domain-containing protein [Phycicoccus sp. MAQZ13P-2]|uniref:heavy-metal-associated domain-containing protein n=1 Tax=Phycicoccus mangrovi TaxID=2840470 RepID=UPI001C006071|nr:heavy-metal-associated domain-containing protein [Phycicoccus mangrovi]MBT9256781.1 heavy-metal-associated domain-containing protein [Phycicoccus mangrovi]MBT9274655.1 heavy-metal-associated domain-containing protein [Phycicoccus mangrovi]
MPSTQQFRATGLTCGHCAHAVTEELTALDGVDDVAVEVVSGGESVVTVTGRELTDAEVAAALDEAGDYALVTA